MDRQHNIKLKLTLDDRDLERQAVDGTRRANERARQQSRTGRDPASDLPRGEQQTSRSRSRLAEDERAAREADRLRRQYLQAQEGIANAAVRLANVSRLLRNPFSALLDIQRIRRSLATMHRTADQPGQQVQSLANVSRLSQTYQHVYRAARLVPPPPSEVAPMDRARPVRPSSPVEMVAEHAAQRAEQFKSLRDVAGAGNKGVVAEMRARGESSLRNILGPLYPTEGERQVGTNLNRPKEPIAIHAARSLPRFRKMLEYLESSRGHGFGSAAATALEEGSAASGAGAGALAGGIGRTAMAGGRLAALAGPIGIAAAGILAVGFLAKKFGEGMESLVNTLGRYNPQVAGEMAALEVKQKILNRQTASALQPMMSAWNQLKSSWMDLKSGLVKLAEPAFQAMGWVMQKVADGFKGILGFFGFDNGSLSAMQKKLNAGFVGSLINIVGGGVPQQGRVPAALLNVAGGFGPAPAAAAGGVIAQARAQAAGMAGGGAAGGGMVGGGAAGGFVGGRVGAGTGLNNDQLKSITFPAGSRFHERYHLDAGSVLKILSDGGSLQSTIEGMQLPMLGFPDTAEAKKDVADAKELDRKYRQMLRSQQAKVLSHQSLAGGAGRGGVRPFWPSGVFRNVHGAMAPHWIPGGAPPPFEPGIKFGFPQVSVRQFGNDGPHGAALRLAAMEQGKNSHLVAQRVRLLGELSDTERSLRLIGKGINPQNLDAGALRDREGKLKGQIWDLNRTLGRGEFDFGGTDSTKKSTSSMSRTVTGAGSASESLKRLVAQQEQYHHYFGDGLPLNIKFEQNIKQIIHDEKTVQESIFQIRDKLLAGLEVSRDETKLGACIAEGQMMGRGLM